MVKDARTYLEFSILDVIVFLNTHVVITNLFVQLMDVALVSLLLIFDRYLSTGSSRPNMFCKKGVVKNFSKFTRKHLSQRLFSNKVAGCGVYTGVFL